MNQEIANLLREAANALEPVSGLSRKEIHQLIYKLQSKAQELHPVLDDEKCFNNPLLR